MLPVYLVSIIPATLRPYAKFVAPAFFAIVATVIRAATTGNLDAPELEIAVVGFLAATAAFVVQNAPSGFSAYLKSIVPAVLTVLAVIVHYFVTGSWDQAEWTLAIAGLGSAFITLLLPNGTENLLPPSSTIETVSQSAPGGFTSTPPASTR